MINGEKTIIKGVTKEHASQIYEWVNQEELRTLTGTAYPVSEYEHEEWIRHITTSSERKLFLVCEKESGIAIGTIGLKNFDNLNRNVDLFISIGSRSHVSSNGNSGGYGTDAVATLVKYCFEHLNFHKVSVRVFASNIRAIRCYEKVGFQTEGILRDHHFSNGKYEDVIVMGILAPV